MTSPATPPHTRMDATRRVPLLGRLLQRGFGTSQLEVMATFALTALLEPDAVSDQFSECLAERAGDALPGGLRFAAEAQTPGRGRIDVAGFQDEVVHVIIEAKFDAVLTEAQLRHYVDSCPAAALLVTVAPESRLGEARRMMENIAGLRTLALSWLDVCDDLDATSADPGDLEQFRALCEIGSGFDVAPLQPADLGDGRTNRMDDFITLVDRVTATLHARLSDGQRMLPLRGAEAGYRAYRYLRVPGQESVYLSVGVRNHDVAPEGPFWLRWHRDSNARRGIEGIAAALQHAGVSTERDGGHIWVHLPAPTDVGAARVVAHLMHRVLELRDITSVVDPAGA